MNKIESEILIGRHVIGDLRSCNREKLESRQVVQEILEMLPKFIGVSPIFPPTVLEYKGKKKEDWGYSGIALFRPGQLSIHTYPERGFVWVDILSSQPFDRKEAIAKLAEAFESRDPEINFFDRTQEPLAR